MINDESNTDTQSSGTDGMATFSMPVYDSNGVKITYTITYVDAAHGENNVVNSNPTTYDVKSGAITLIAPTRTGYEFGDPGHQRRVYRRGCADE